MRDYLEFEKPLREVEEKIEKLAASGGTKAGVQDEIRKLRMKLAQLEHELYAKLTPWQRTQLARHPQRPSTLDYIGEIFRDFLEFHGDRSFGDDRAIVGGFARFNDRSIMVIGHQKGKTLKERMQRNFGMPNPEGYRKALRLMKMAEKFGRPIVTFIDTPGRLSRHRSRRAWPGRSHREKSVCHVAAHRPDHLDRHRRGRQWRRAGARCVRSHPHARARRVFRDLSEGCAAILWDDPAKVPDAAASLKMTAQDLVDLRIVDDVIPEPLGGAHREPKAVTDRVAKALTNQLSQLTDLSLDQLLTQRDHKYRRMGAVTGLDVSAN
jgi:acetyl-CoA carboxylase carboxyl transferase subunit alpha